MYFQSRELKRPTRCVSLAARASVFGVLRGSWPPSHSAPDLASADAGIGSTATTMGVAANGSGSAPAAGFSWRLPEAPPSRHGPGGSLQPAFRGLDRQEPFSEGRSSFGQARRPAASGFLPSDPAQSSGAAAQGTELPPSSEGQGVHSRQLLRPHDHMRRSPSLSALRAGARAALRHEVTVVHVVSLDFSPLTPRVCDLRAAHLSVLSPQQQQRSSRCRG